MGAKRTQTRAYEICDHVEGYIKSDKDFKCGFAIDKEKVPATREIVYKELKRRGLGGQVTISYDEGNTFMWVMKRKFNREQQLVAMVRRLMAHCDNERLYDEALELVKIE